MQKKRQILLMITAIIFCIATVKGQENMKINAAGSSTIIAIEDIQLIRFSSDNMIVKANNNENNYPISNDMVITFSDELVNINVITKDIEVNVYVNAYGGIIVESPYEISRLTVLDMNGRELKISKENNLNASFLSSGMYILKIETSKGIVNKKFLKN